MIGVDLREMFLSLILRVKTRGNDGTTKGGKVAALGDYVESFLSIRFSLMKFKMRGKSYNIGDERPNCKFIKLWLICPINV